MYHKVLISNDPQEQGLSKSNGNYQLYPQSQSFKSNSQNKQFFIRASTDWTLIICYRQLIMSDSSILHIEVLIVYVYVYVRSVRA